MRFDSPKSSAPRTLKLVEIAPLGFGVPLAAVATVGATLLNTLIVAVLVLFVLARISKLSIERTTMAILPWLIPLLASLIAITLFPELTLWLPRQAGFIK